MMSLILVSFVKIMTSYDLKCVNVKSYKKYLASFIFMVLFSKKGHHMKLEKKNILK